MLIILCNAINNYLSSKNYPLCQILKIDCFLSNLKFSLKEKNKCFDIVNVFVNEIHKNIYIFHLSNILILF